MERKQSDKAVKAAVLEKLRVSSEVFIIFSRCTNMPYVYCEQVNYNDQIYVYYLEKDAREAAKRIIENDKMPVQVIKLPNQQFLNFYSTLYTIGVNAILVNGETDQEMEVGLQELIKRPDYSKLAKNKVNVENPQFHLTALYFMQELRKTPKPVITEHIKELEEEMMVNLRKGTFIAPVQEDKKIPFMKMKNDAAYQPIFTDASEFNKFNKTNKDKKFKGAVVKYADLHKILLEQTNGFIVNPLGFHLILTKKQVAGANSGR